MHSRTGMPPALTLVKPYELSCRGKPNVLPMVPKLPMLVAPNTIQEPPLRRIHHWKLHMEVGLRAHVLAAIVKLSMNGILAAAPLGTAKAPLENGAVSAYDVAVDGSRVLRLTAPPATGTRANVTELGAVPVSPYAKKLGGSKWVSEHDAVALPEAGCTHHALALASSSTALRLLRESSPAPSRCWWLPLRRAAGRCMVAAMHCVYGVWGGLALPTAPRGGRQPNTKSTVQAIG